MDSYVRPLIYKDTQGSCSLLIESNACEQLKALNCPLAFFMWMLHMTYLIHRKHNSIFSFFKIHIIKSILVFQTTNSTAIGRRKSEANDADRPSNAELAKHVDRTKQAEL